MINAKRAVKWNECIRRGTAPLDVRSLGLFRIAIGLILICDIVDRFRHIELYLVHHWTPESSFGLPNSVVSFLLNAGDSVDLQKTFLAALMLAACFYLAGYKTTLSNAVAWFLLLVLHHFQPRLLNSGDKLLRLFMFWSLFLPVGKRFSLDALITPGARENSTEAPRLASLALMIQVASPYIFSAIFKLSTQAWRDGLGLYYSFTRDDEVKALGLLLSELPRTSLSVMNYTVLVVELLAPLLIFSPLANSRFRLGLVIAFIAFHMGMYLTLDVGQFTFICSAGLLALIPASVWGHQILAKDEATRWIRSAVDYGILAALWVSLVWNIESLPVVPPVMPESVRSVGYSLGLKQRFSMYSGVGENGGWMTMPGLLVDGTTVDLFVGGKPLSKQRPRIVSETFFSEHWRKLIERTVKLRDATTMRHLADYYCRSWNSTHEGDKRLMSYSIAFMHQRSPADSDRTEPVRKKRFTQNCDGE